MDISIRKAISSDIRIIKKLLSFYCLDTDKVEDDLPGFLVAIIENKIVGCACLDIGEIVELRSIAVLPGFRNRGIGSRLVDAILARATGVTDTVFLRTTSPAFFEKKGFKSMNNDMKKEVWKDCAECDMFEICRQVMMKISLC